MKISKNSKLVMIGDSITDTGRVRPIGEGRDAFGAGYVAQVNALIASTYPSHQIRIVNQGVSGNTVRDLKQRWQSDVLDLNPDWLSIMIGINDVWRHFDLPQHKERHVGIHEYEKTLDELVDQTKNRIKGLVLMTPYFIELNRKDAMRMKMDQYGAVVRKIALKHRVIFVDTQKAFDAVLKSMHPMELAWDRVHPNQTGHMVIAKAFLNAIGFVW